MYQADNVVVKVGKKVLLNDVSIAIKPGQVVVVIGPNGAGKSTLLKALSAEMETVTGDVHLNGRSLNDWSSKDQARQRAVLPQRSNLTFLFRVHEAVSMGRSPHAGTSLVEEEKIIQQAMELAEVWHLKDRIYPTLSGGERQRVQLARVLSQIWEEVEEGERYLLLDEPTSALDLMHQHHVLGVARNLSRSKNMGVLAVLHDLNLAAMYADSIVVLKDGKFVCEGAPEMVLTQPIIKQTFGITVDVSKHPHQDCPLIVAHRAATC